MSREMRIRRIWNTVLLLAGSGLIYLTFTPDMTLSIGGGWQYVALILLAFVAEYVDSSLGMGYGTTLTPLLLILGFTPLEIVPAVLLSEFVSGISAGVLHHKLGNVDLSRGTRAHRTVWILSGCSIVGAVIAVLLALTLPMGVVKLYIGVMILSIGIFIMFGKGIMGRFRWRKIVGLGTLAAFNKGISGGGYGPLLTGGQVLVGVPEKNAVGITSFAEGVVCLVGLSMYIALKGLPEWGVAIPLTIGAILSVPAATMTVKVLPEKLLCKSIGYSTMFLGVLTLVKIVF